MPPRPSEPLLVFLRDAIRRKGLSTADLAERLGRERGEIKRALAGTDPLTVDDLVLLSQALQLTPAELGIGPPEPTEEEPAPVPLRVASSAAAAVASPPEDEGPDPLGNLPEQVMRMGFTLGLDLFVDCDSTQLKDSGIPASALAAAPRVIRLTFPAKYHRHNRPQFGVEMFACRLSFDKIYDVSLPWSSFRVVSTVFPEEAPPPAPPPEPATKPRPALRLVK